MKYIKTYEDLNKYDTLDLYNAAIGDDLIKIKKIVDFGVDINSKYNDYSPIMLVSNASSIKELIKIGADPDLQTMDGFTALIFAASTASTEKNKRYENMKIIKELIKGGANWNILDSNNKDFLHYLDDDQKQEIIEEFPEEYEKYKINKNTQKYNL